jgi:acyl-CoA thioester hydrolase
VRSYSCRFKVRQYELDSFGHVNNAVYVNYLQEAAIEASTDAGFDMEWYAAHGTRWLIRSLAIRYFAQATYGDEIEVTTWVSDIRRVRSNREYDVRRVSDGQRLARARADWVYVDAETGRPRRVPDGALQAFQPTGEQPNIGVRLRGPQTIEGCFRYHSARRAQVYELDVARHVNHAHYVRWVEQAYFDATASVGYPLSRALDEGIVILQSGHDTEFFYPAQDGDRVEIVSWVCEMQRVRGAWTHEVFNAESGQLLARDYSLGVFLDAGLKPMRLPERFLARILAGPDGGGA